MDLATYYKQHPEERYENICRMGEILSQVEQTLSKAEALLEEWKALQPDFDSLVSYYDSELWRNDYFDSNAGKIPEDVPQWVLTQDAIFDAIGDQFHIADAYQELLQTIEKKKWKS